MDSTESTAYLSFSMSSMAILFKAKIFCVHYNEKKKNEGKNQKKLIIQNHTYLEINWNIQLLSFSEHF